MEIKMLGLSGREEEKRDGQFYPWGTSMTFELLDGPSCVGVDGVGAGCMDQWTSCFDPGFCGRFITCLCPPPNMRLPFLPFVRKNCGCRVYILLRDGESREKPCSVVPHQWPPVMMMICLRKLRSYLIPSVIMGKVNRVCVIYRRLPPRLLMSIPMTQHVHQFQETGGLAYGRYGYCHPLYSIWCTVPRYMKNGLW